MKTRILIITSLFFLFCGCTKKNLTDESTTSKITPVVVNQDSNPSENKLVEIEKKKMLLEGKIISKEKYLEIKKYYNPLLEGKKIDDEWFIIEIELEKSGSSFEKEFYNHYGNLFVKYQRLDYYFPSGKIIYFPIIQIEYYYKRNNELIKLGYLDRFGIYDKNGNIILQSPKNDGKLVGYPSADLFSDPFSVNYCYYEEADLESLFLTDVYAMLNIDYINNTITATSMAEILDYALKVVKE